MSAARDLFLQVHWPSPHGDKAAYEKLCQAAELWRSDGQYFSAGMAMSRASDAAWGQPDVMLAAHQAAMTDFERVLTTNPPDSPASLSALFKLSQALVRASRLSSPRLALFRCPLKRATWSILGAASASQRQQARCRSAGFVRRPPINSI